MIGLIWNNWFVIAFIAPALWALINLIDLYFIGDVYASEYEGAIITGFVQLSAWLAVPFLGFTMPDGLAIFLAMLAGFILIMSYFFYFKTLFKTSDASLVLILWNVVAVVTPLLAFIFLAERLTARQYLGIVIVLAGVFAVSLHENIKINNFKKIISYMTVAVLLYSIHMIIAREAYERMDFYEGILFYSLGAVVGGFLFYVLNYYKYHREHFTFLKHCHNFFKTKKTFAKWFLLVEVVSFSGVIVAQRAIDLGPSVSLVAVIESIQPAFIIVFSILFYLFALIFLRKKKNTMKFFHNEQLVGLPYKLIAIIVMAFGIYLLN